MRHSLRGITISTCDTSGCSMRTSTVVLFLAAAFWEEVSSNCKWTRFKDREFCIGPKKHSFRAGRLFCSAYIADYPVFNNKEVHAASKSVLGNSSVSDEEIFIGIYQPRCSTQSGCSEVFPWSGEFYWITDNQTQISSLSTGTWKIFDTPNTYISAFNSVSTASKNKMYFVMDRAGVATAVEGFTDPAYMAYPMCVRQVWTTTTASQSTPAHQKSNKAVSSSLALVHLTFLAILLPLVL